jgi:small subunit ribosomal protein S2
LRGTLPNFHTIERSLNKCQKLTLEESNQFAQIHKKEAAVIHCKMNRIHISFAGLMQTEEPLAALFIKDIRHEHLAVVEIKKLIFPCSPSSIQIRILR